MRLRDAVMAAVLLALMAGCRRSVPAPPAPDAAPVVLRFPPGAAAPSPGCFAWSRDLGTHACTLGHHEPDAEGTSLAIAFVGPTSRPGLPLAQGHLDEGNRSTLDAAMVAGSYVAVGDRAWAAAGQRTTVGEHLVSLEGDTVRVERGGAKIFERVEHRIGRFVTRCELRTSAQGPARIVVERRCMTRDEGVDVTELDAWSCDATHCA